ncbi:MAG TPA: pilus assembly protein N-terminal domain-containing protein, partial [bacterium]|nr:pilus assembly protein N-terminal domain-containing protein [bacterium]
MKIFLIAAASVVVLHPRPAAAAAEILPQTIMKGHSSTIQVDYEVGDAAVADPAVCDFLISKDRRSVYINGRGGGETVL